MKLHKFTLLLLVASVAVTGCGKRKITDKAEETPGEQNATTGAAKTDVNQSTASGPVIIGDTSKFDELSKAFTAESDKATLRLTAAYIPSTKKLTLSKEQSALKIVSVDANGKSAPADLKTIAKVPTMTLEAQTVDIQADEAQQQYILKNDATTDADASKAITVGIKSDDEKLKIEETKYELSPIVLLGTAQEQTQELVLDLSKGEAPSDIGFVAAYNGAEGDPTKPECVLISAAGIGAVKPIKIAGLDLSNQDRVWDLSAVKDQLAKIPAGETEFEIDCIRVDESKNPALITVTRTLGFKLKVIQPEVKKEEPKKEEGK